MAAPVPFAVEVRSNLVFEVREPTTLAIHVALAGATERLSEDLHADGGDVELVELGGDGRNRVHLIEARPGRLSVDYEARARVSGGPPVVPTVAERLVALRQSRYCPSDQIEGYVATELGQLRGRNDAHREVAAWVHRRLVYEPGTSGPGDTAIDTLLLGQGVCRDFAHLTVMLCRSLGIPARFVAVYAPGLSPMDFHAVAEVAGPDGWEILDATRIAPRPSLVRIATGRDAADTALVTVVDGHADLVETSVVATVDGDLPTDDHRSPVSIA